MRVKSIDLIYVLLNPPMHVIIFSMICNGNLLFTKIIKSRRTKIKKDYFIFNKYRKI